MLVFSGCVQETQGQDYDTTSIEQLTNEKNIVLIQYTADWCANCILQENKFSSDEFALLFENNNIITIKIDCTEWTAEMRKDIAQHETFGLPIHVIYSNKSDFQPKILSYDPSIDEIKENI